LELVRKINEDVVGFDLVSTKADPQDPQTQYTKEKFTLDFKTKEELMVGK